MIRAALALVAVLVAAPVFGQSVVLSYDLSVLGIDAPDNPKAIDTDGNPMTEEYLVSVDVGTGEDERGKELRVVAVRDGLCLGPRFIVSAAWTLDRIRGRHALTRTTGQSFLVMPLDTPRCDAIMRPR